MAAAASATSTEIVSLVPSRFSAGFQMTSIPPSTATSYTYPDTASGHPGYGGSLGFGDPHGELSFGYTLNRHGGSGPDALVRGQALIDAVYAAVGGGAPAAG
jgi:hypothetical protein